MINALAFPLRFAGKGAPSESRTFRESVNAHEAELIATALKKTNNSITATARILGFNHHQSLISLLDGRHSSLRPRPKIRRRKSKRGAGDWGRAIP